MTLKEKFTNSIVLPFEYEEKIQKSLVIADEFAIEFAEWAIDYSFNGMYSNDVKELLEEFKKEKGL
jgi:hypothetical protein